MTPAITAWITAQLWCFLLAYISAKEETPVVFVFRKYLAKDNPFQRPFHVWGWWLIAAAAAPWILANGVWGGPWQMGAAIPVLIAIYWWRFEAWLNQWTHKHRHYTGEDAATDRWLRRVFGAHAGRTKNRACVAVILVANTIFFIIQLAT